MHHKRFSSSKPILFSYLLDFARASSSDWQESGSLLHALHDLLNAQDGHDTLYKEHQFQILTENTNERNPNSAFCLFPAVNSNSFAALSVKTGFDVT